jgi:hypothetical protein
MGILAEQKVARDDKIRTTKLHDLYHTGNTSVFFVIWDFLNISFRHSCEWSSGLRFGCLFTFTCSASCSHEVYNLKNSHHCPRRELNPSCPARSLVSILTELPRLQGRLDEVVRSQSKELVSQLRFEPGTFHMQVYNGTSTELIQRVVHRVLYI